MNTIILRNLLLVIEYGSIARAAGAANLTSQALGAQIRVAERRFGFQLFDRTREGLQLTAKGRGLLPYVKNVVATTQLFEQQIKSLEAAEKPLLRIALNSTFDVDTNIKIINNLRRILPDIRLEFSLDETHSNVLKLNSDETDLAVIIGGRLQHVVNYELSNVEVEITLATSKSNHFDVVDQQPLFIAPSASCSYFRSVRVLRGNLPISVRKTINSIYSDSEQVTVDMIQRFGAIGIVSKASVERNDLVCINDSADHLKVFVGAGSKKLDTTIIKCINMSLGTNKVVASERVHNNSNQHRDHQAP